MAVIPLTTWVMSYRRHTFLTAGISHFRKDCEYSLKPYWVCLTYLFDMFHFGWLLSSICSVSPTMAEAAADTFNLQEHFK